MDPRTQHGESMPAQQGRAIAASVVLLVFAAGLHLLFAALAPALRPRPAFVMVPWVLAVLAGCPVLMIGARMFKRRGETHGKTRAATWALLVAHLTTLAGGSLAVVVSDPNFFYGDHYVARLALPGWQTALLYRGGLFCRYDVYVVHPWSLFGEQADPDLGQTCRIDDSARLERFENEYRVVDSKGEPFPSPAPIVTPEMLDIGPH